ncbi:ABC-three component system middle component 6 [Microbacterium sp. AGC62]
MITPTKGIAPQRALLSVAAQISESLSEPMSVSQAWDALASWRIANGATEPLSFAWFSYALDVLYTIGAVHFDDGILYKIGGQ